MNQLERECLPMHGGVGSCFVGHVRLLSEREFGKFVSFRREAELGRISSACKEICQGMAGYVLPIWQAKRNAGKSFVGAL